MLQLQRDIRKFKRGEERALRRAAQVATTTSRSRFRSQLSGRPHAPARPGRQTTGGNFARMIRWQIEPYKRGGVEGTVVAFQVEELQGRAPYWLIQEIGTGESARILDTGETKTVRSQRGRMLSRYLVWADVAGTYDVDLGERQGSRGSGARQQLMSYKDVKNAPLKVDLEPRRIGKEIEGKNYIRTGGRQANQQYQDTLLGLARQVFDKPR